MTKKRPKKKRKEKKTQKKYKEKKKYDLLLKLAYVTESKKIFAQGKKV